MINKTEPGNNDPLAGIPGRPPAAANAGGVAGRTAIPLRPDHPPTSDVHKAGTSTLGEQDQPQPLKKSGWRSWLPSLPSWGAVKQQAQAKANLKAQGILRNYVPQLLEYLSSDLAYTTHPYQEAAKAKLKMMTGNDNLYTLTDTLFEKNKTRLIDVAKEMIKKMDLSPEYKQELAHLIDKEQAIIFQVVKATLLNGVRNWVEDIWLQQPEESRRNVTIVDVLGRLYTTLNESLEEVHQHQQQLNDIEDPEEQNKFAAILMEPLAAKLLHMVFPHGADDMLLPKFTLSGTVSSYLYEAIKGAVPQVLATVLPSLEEARQVIVKTRELSEEHRILQPGLPNLTPLLDAAVAVGQKQIATYNNHETIIALTEKAGVDLDEAAKEALLNEIGRFADPKNGQLTPFWDFVKQYAGNLINGVVISASMPHPDPDHQEEAPKGVLARGIANFVKALQVIVNEDFPHLELLQTRPLEEGESVLERESKVQASYERMAERIIALTGFELDNVMPLPLALRGFVLARVKEDFIPAALQRLRHVITELAADGENTSDRLRELTGDSPAQLEPGAPLIVAIPQQADTATQIEMVTGIVAGDIRDAVQDYVAATPLNLAQMVVANLPEGVQVDSAALAWVDDVVKELAQSNSAPLRDMWGIGQELIHEVLNKAIISIATKTASVHGTINLSDALIAILRAGGEHIPQIERSIDEALAKKGEGERQKAVDALFIPLSRHLISLVTEDLLEGMPLTAEQKQGLLNRLGEVILPSVLSKTYLEMTALIRKNNENKGELRRIYGAERVAEAARVIGRFTADMIPAQLLMGNAQIAAMVTPWLEHYMAQHTDAITPERIQAFINQRGGEIQEMVARNILVVGQSGMPEAKDAVAGLVEGVMLQLLTGFSQTVDMTENDSSTPIYNPNLLMDVAMEALETAVKHFKTVNDIAKQENHLHPHNVPSATMRERYYGRVYPGRYGPEEIAAKKRQDDFYKTLTAQFMELGNFRSPQDLPVPPQMQEMVWEKLRGGFAPDILRSIFESLLDPGTLDTIALNALNAINEAPEPIDDEEEQELTPDDEIQKKLNKRCGDLVLQIVNLVPKTMTKSLFRYEKVKTVTAEAVGAAFRKGLASQTLVGIIGDAVTRGLTNFPAGSKWVSVDGRDRLVSAEGQEVEFQFPQSAEELAAQAKVKAETDIETRKKLKAAIMRTVRIQVNRSIGRTLLGKWKAFQTRMDNAIRKHFGKVGMALKKALDVFCHMVFSTLFVIPIWMLYTIISKTIWLVTKPILAGKAEHIIETLHMTIHENLLDDIVEDVVAKILERRDLHRKFQTFQAVGVDELYGDEEDVVDD